MNPRYSYQTSLPAYRSGESHKKIQKAKVLALVSQGCNNLLLISEQSGILQAVVSARVNQLIEDGEVIYSSTVVYKSRKRKRIIIKPIQTELF